MTDTEIKAAFDSAAKRIDADARAREIEKTFQTLPDADLNGISPTPLPPGAKPDPGAHPREAVMEAAGAELVAFLSEWAPRHKLTGMEYAYLLAVPTHRQLQALCIHEREHREK